MIVDTAQFRALVAERDQLRAEVADAGEIRGAVVSLADAVMAFGDTLAGQCRPVPPGVVRAGPARAAAPGVPAARVPAARLAASHDQAPATRLPARTPPLLTTVVLIVAGVVILVAAVPSLRNPFPPAGETGSAPFTAESCSRLTQLRNRWPAWPEVLSAGPVSRSIRTGPAHARNG